MGQNLSTSNPLGFFPDHQLDPAFRANTANPDWDFNPNKDTWPDANKVGAGAFGLGQIRLLPLPIASHQTRQDPRVRGLYFPAGGSSSGTVNPVPTTVSHISSIFSRIGDPALNMENITSGFLGPLLVLQAGFFLLTRILTIPQSLDSWWTSLNFLGGTTVCLGQNSQSPTSNHSPTSCPPT
uniref:Truncated large S protein n=1 Tax=Hepatitis B virus TaxID=10407 RepID=G9G985_HBV|nr:truncated large S protein [Hepatitis B virus]